MIRNSVRFVSVICVVRAPYS